MAPEGSGFVGGVGRAGWAAQSRLPRVHTSWAEVKGWIGALALATRVSVVISYSLHATLASASGKEKFLRQFTSSG